MSLLFSPIYSWLKRRRIPTPLALVIMLVGLTVLFVGLFFVLGVSVARFGADIGSYTAQLDQKMAGIETLIKNTGITRADIRNVVQPSDLTSAVGAILGGIGDFLSNLFLILIIVLFLLAEGPAMMNRLQSSVGSNHPQAERLVVFGRNVVRQLGLRAVVNLITGAGVVALLVVLGVDFPVMWGILTFFLSFIPWIGLPIAVAPAVILALAEHGLERALLVVAGVIVINVVAENLISPMLMGRGLSLSPTFLFLGFIFWAFVLGGPGAFLAAPLTIFVVLMLGTFPGTRWLASLMGTGIPDPDAPNTDNPETENGEPGSPASEEAGSS
ncbi:MAG: AI-2E family transporter [Rubrobacteraceae bacterium]